jgi:copper transport protein
MHSARLLLLGLIAALLAVSLQPGRTRARFEWALVPLAAAVAWTFSEAGHPDTTKPPWLSILADSLHLLAMAAWVGGLVMVVAALLPRREPDELAEVLPVFSAVAFTAVIVMASTGTYAAWRGVGSWGALFTTEYGLLVDAKIALFVALLSLGNISRVTIARRLRRLRRPVVAYAMTADVLDSPGAAEAPDEPELTANEAERMRRSVWVEVVIAAVVLAFTAVLVSQPRGAEAIATRNRNPVSGTANIGGGHFATVGIRPGTHGAVEVSVDLSGGFTPQQLVVTASEPAKQLGPIPVPVVAEGSGQYAASAVDLPVAGKWVIELIVTTSKFDSVTADVNLTLH